MIRERSDSTPLGAQASCLLLGRAASLRDEEQTGRLQTETRSTAVQWPREEARPARRRRPRRVTGENSSPVTGRQRVTDQDFSPVTGRQRVTDEDFSPVTGRQRVTGEDPSPVTRPHRVTAEIFSAVTRPHRVTAEIFSAVTRPHRVTAEIFSAVTEDAVIRPYDDGRAWWIDGPCSVPSTSGRRGCARRRRRLGGRWRQSRA